MKKLVCDVCGKEGKSKFPLVTISGYHTLSIWVYCAAASYIPNLDFALCTEHYIEALEKAIQELKEK